MIDLKSRPQKVDAVFLLTLLAVAAVVAGVVIRFMGLGNAALVDDEYYLARSAMNILNGGLPEFSTGGFYTRGLIQQYLTALLISLPLDFEWAVRLVPVLCNLLCIPALYLLGCRLGSKTIALSAIILFSLSLWEIEFARFARMYAPLQMVFVWFLYFWTNWIIDGSQSARKYAITIAVVSVLVHQASILIMAMCLIPVFLQNRPKFSVDFLFLLVGFAVFTTLRLYVPLPQTVALESLPELSSPVKSVFALIPGIAAPYLQSSTLHATLFGLLLLCSLTLIAMVWRKHIQIIAIPLLMTVSILSLCLNMMAVSAITFALAMLVFLAANEESRVFDFPHCFSFTVLFLAWLALFTHLLYTSDAWYGSLSQIDLQKYPGKNIQLLAVLFNYPEILSRYIKPMLQGAPIAFATLWLFTLLGLGCQLLPKVRKSPVFLYIFMALLVSILFVSITGSLQKTSRYSFFCYPILMVLASSGAHIVLQTLRFNHRVTGLGMLLSTIAIVVIADDYRLEQSIYIDSPEVAYKIGSSNNWKKHYLTRRDFESPSQYINLHREDNDIVVSATTPSDIYIDGGLDYIYMPYSTNRFWERNIDASGLDFWSGARILYSEEMVYELVRSSENPIWLMTFAIGWDNKTDSTFRNRFASQLVYTSIDGTIDVFRIAR